MSSAYLVIPSMRRNAATYAHMKQVAFDAFIPINLGVQYLMGRGADFWVIAPEAKGEMPPEYLSALQGRVDARAGSRIIELDDYLDELFNLED